MNTQLDFSQNLNALGPPPSIRMIAADVSVWNRYPSSDGKPIRQAVASFLRVPCESVSVGAGATQLNFLLPFAIEADRAVIPIPTFWEYKVANVRLGRPIARFDLRDTENLETDLNRLDSFIATRDVVYICNPNNPTSDLIPRENLANLIRAHPTAHFIVDETYLLFLSDFQTHTLSSLAANLGNLHVLFSLSKLLSLPGARVGVLVSTPDFSRRLIDYYMPPFISNRFAEEAIPVALQDTGYIAAARDTVRAGHQWLEIEARPALSARIRILPAKANFALAQVTHPSKGFDLPSKLAARGILVRSGHDIEGLSNSWFRFSIRAERENRILTDTLLDLLN